MTLAVFAVTNPMRYGTYPECEFAGDTRALGVRHICGWQLADLACQRVRALCRPKHGADP